MAYDLKFGKVTVQVDSEKNPLNSADEPVFLLRAQDQSSLLVLKAYGDFNQDLIPELSKVYEAFSEWQKNNAERVKVAD